MISDFIKCFNNDTQPLLRKEGGILNIGQIKELIRKEAGYLSGLKEDIITIDASAFDFIIIFLACAFINKKINVINSNSKENVIEKSSIEKEVKDFDPVDVDFSKIYNIKTYFYTSGTTGNSKCIEKDLDTLLIEARAISKTFNFKNGIEFISSAPINHTYTIACYFLLPILDKGIINTDRINYAEDLTIKNSVLITSPSFMSYIEQNNIIPIVRPDCILSAGAKLKDETYKYFEKFSKVIDIYGSTETGVIGYKDKSSIKAFIPFYGVKVSENRVISDYSNTELSDKLITYENGNFEVLGRVDRIYKINEKRISADEIEKAIINHKFSDDCYCIKSENKLCALVKLSDEGFNYLKKTNSTVQLIKEFKKELSQKFEIIPKKWKFTDKLPLDKLGKYDRKKIEEIFNINLSLPVILNRKIEKESAEFELLFHKNCNFYKGHFEGFPITAGVVQLYFANFFLKTAFGIDCHMGQIKRIKFSNIIHAGSIVNLKLTKATNGVNFEYSYEDKKYSSGLLPTINYLGAKE